jgi:hypothetical protein
MRSDAGEGRRNVLTFNCSGGLSIDWHAGEPWPSLGKVCGESVRVSSIQADGYELALILSRITPAPNAAGRVAEAARENMEKLRSIQKDPEYERGFCNRARDIIAAEIARNGRTPEYLSLGIETEKLEQLAGIHDALIRIEAALLHREPGTDSSPATERACSNPKE